MIVPRLLTNATLVWTSACAWLTDAMAVQVALIVIMAQIGSFVPAKFASMRVVDKLFTRIGTSDSIETNSSSFMVEMQETARIVNHATDK